MFCPLQNESEFQIKYIFMNGSSRIKIPVGSPVLLQYSLSPLSGKSAFRSSEGINFFKNTNQNEQQSAKRTIK